jgi:hypothetical protein
MAEGGGNEIPISNIISEDGAHELATSANMQPYIRLAMALLQDVDATRQLDEVAALPLEKRYIWRVASALKWGFADFDDVNVETAARRCSGMGRIHGALSPGRFREVRASATCPATWAHPADR